MYSAIYMRGMVLPEEAILHLSMQACAMDATGQLIRLLSLMCIGDNVG